MSYIDYETLIEIEEVQEFIEIFKDRQPEIYDLYKSENLTDEDIYEIILSPDFNLGKVV